MRWLDRSSLTHRLVHALIPDFAHANADWQEENDSSYALLAAAFHLETLVAAYVTYADTATSSAQARIEAGQPAGVMMAIDDRRVYYSIDSFFESARRFYEQLRRVLWKRYSPPGTDLSRPRSFEQTLKTVILPPQFRASLEDSWEQIGSTLKAYRECVSHNDPLNEGHTNVRVYPMDDRWGLDVRLPENPHAKSRSAYRFDSGPEALTYCHQVLCHLTDVAEGVSREVGL